MPHERLAPGRQSSGIRFFSSAADAPRLRRPSDVMLVLAGLFALVPLTLLAPGPRALHHAVTDLLHGFGGWWTGAWTVGYAVLVIWPEVLVLVALACRGRRRLLLDWLVAEVLAVGLALVAGGWPERRGRSR